MARDVVWNLESRLRCLEKRLVYAFFWHERSNHLCQAGLRAHHAAPPVMRPKHSCILGWRYANYRLSIFIAQYLAARTGCWTLKPLLQPCTQGCLACPKTGIEYSNGQVLTSNDHYTSLILTSHGPGTPFWTSG